MPFPDATIFLPVWVVIKPGHTLIYLTYHIFARLNWLPSSIYLLAQAFEKNLFCAQLDVKLMKWPNAEMCYDEMTLQMVLTSFPWTSFQ